ncbi:MAG TPA: bifunctional diaminohydroxyphosphoribosylaminopyrimidine deaminase/5-amino-6-(5-phosphoribosylamino)uracil reductase RibD [Coxiellaceae bacterium]|nr:bifunctional diaminohydroxyphosphoribosylaminopyrimidine deaminase/5-amino-6-(5-phosphoribosylamino)uracil reductase RibD [Coxiellaceae bacterium]
MLIPQKYTMLRRMDHEPIDFLKKALILAQNYRGFCAPNPAVGAVVVKNGEIIAEGTHQGVGTWHAERDALLKVGLAKGADLYVTLEPCCHHGRTPPCTDSIIEKGIRRVYYGFLDPNPIMAGKGIATLQAAGIECYPISHYSIEQFYQSYAHWWKTKRPFVTAKIALSADYKIAREGGKPARITGEALSQWTHTQRQHTDAILTTATTLMADDSQLNARFPHGTISKPVFVLDRVARLPLDRKIFKTAQSVKLLVSRNIPASHQTISIEEKEDGLNLHQVMEVIGQQGIHDLWVEAGPTLFDSLWKNHLLHRVWVYRSSKTLGEKALPGPQSSDFINQLAGLQWTACGEDQIAVWEPSEK